MARPRFGSTLLCLCVMLVGLMASTGIAQAEPNAFWLVNGTQFTSGLSPTVEAETDVVGTLLTTLGGQLIDLTCQKIELVGAHLVEPVAQFTGKALFHECDFLSLKKLGEPAVLQKACEPFVGANKGLIETNNFTGLIKLHKTVGGVTEGVLEVVPTEGTLFATLNLGKECAFGELLKVGGNATTAAKIFLKEHLLEELKELTKLFVNGGATTMTTDGSAWAFLGGAHKGLTWSGVPA
jgi:hypothetical protein